MKRIALLGAVAFILGGAPCAFAADDSAVMKRLDQMQKMLDAQQRQIESQKKEIGSLSRALGRKGVAMPPPEPVAAPVPAAPPPPVIETRLQQQDQKIDALVGKFAAEQDARRLATQEQPEDSIANGRLSVTSADGRFSAALRATVQYDMGYYMQGVRARPLPAANGPDLSSGSNFRRAQIGLQGKVFGDWSYLFNMDFGSGGSTGTETPGHIQQAFIEYDGLAPFVFRIGAHPPSTGLDDSYAATDQLFMERSAPGDLTRNMAGGDGRDSIELVYQGDRLYGSLAYTGDKVQETTFLFDEQQAVVGRVAYSPVANGDWHWVVSAAATDVFRPGDSTATLNSVRAFSLSNPPELNVDDNSTKFVSVSDTNVTDAWNWNLESAVTYDNFLAQAGYFKYGIDQRGVTTLPGQGFNGWYAEGSWVLTGESRGWSTASAAFANPRPRVNFSPVGGGWGALELAGRYSTLDLNDHEGAVGVALPPGGVRGGEQRIGTLGLNWYPNTALKFTLQLQNTQVSRIGTNTVLMPNVANAGLGQNFQSVAFRSQIAF